jgi:hypothetical protein
MMMMMIALLIDRLENAGEPLQRAIVTFVCVRAGSPRGAALIDDRSAFLDRRNTTLDDD